MNVLYSHFLLEWRSWISTFKEVQLDVSKLNKIKEILIKPYKFGLTASNAEWLPQQPSQGQYMAWDHPAALSMFPSGSDFEKLLCLLFPYDIKHPPWFYSNVIQNVLKYGSSFSGALHFIVQSWSA